MSEGNVQRRWKKKNILSIFLNQNGIICKNDVFFFLHWGEGLLLRHFLTLNKRRVQDGGVLVYCILRELYISGSLKDSSDMASTMSSMKVLKLNRTYFMFFLFISLHPYINLITNHCGFYCVSKCACFLSLYKYNL